MNDPPSRRVFAIMKLRLSVIVLVCFLSSVSVHAAVPGAEALGGLISKHFDSNSDGIVDTGEWQSGMTASFADMDLSHDGNISGDDVDGLKKEMTEELGEVGATVVVALIKQIVMTLDKDADKLVSEKEFSEGDEAMFKKLDANKDGQVSKDELAELPTRLLK